MIPDRWTARPSGEEAFLLVVEFALFGQRDTRDGPAAAESPVEHGAVILRWD